MWRFGFSYTNNATINRTHSLWIDYRSEYWFFSCQLDVNPKVTILFLDVRQFLHFFTIFVTQICELAQRNERRDMKTLSGQNKKVPSYSILFFFFFVCLMFGKHGQWTQTTQTSNEINSIRLFWSYAKWKRHVSFEWHLNGVWMPNYS